MGIVKIKYVILLLLLNSLAYSQVIRIEKKDSVLLKKANNKREYYITFLNKENIKYNKMNGFKYDTIPYVGTVTKCEKCKEESYSFLIQKIKKKKNKKDSIYTVIDLLKNRIDLNFGAGYFLINGNYYKNLGSPIE